MQEMTDLSRLRKRPLEADAATSAGDADEIDIAGCARRSLTLPRIRLTRSSICWTEAPAREPIERDLAREAIAKQSAVHLEQRIEQGGVIEAAVRALIYVRLSEGKVDERGFRIVRDRLLPGLRPLATSAALCRCAIPTATLPVTAFNSP